MKITKSTECFSFLSDNQQNKQLKQFVEKTPYFLFNRMLQLSVGGPTKQTAKVVCGKNPPLHFNRMLSHFCGSSPLLFNRMLQLSVADSHSSSTECFRISAGGPTCIFYIIISHPMHSNPNQVNESPRSQTSQNPLKNLRDQVQETVWEILERGGDLDVTRQIYDNSAKDYDDDPETQAYFTLEYQKVMELLDIQDGETVLDLGCGTGKYIHKFPTQAQIFGIDLSPEMIAVSQRKNSERKVEYHVGDLKAGLPFPDESFDKINSAHVLKFLTSQNDLEFSFKEIARVLKKGGTFVFTNNHPERKKDFEWADYNLNLPTPTQNTSPDEITIPMHLHTLDNYEEAYKASGLHFVEKSDIRIDETLQSILTKESFAKVQGKRIILAMKFTK